MRRGATALLLLGALAAGCGAGGNSGGSSSSAPPSGAAGREPRAIARDRALVAALGDSITAGSPLWDPVPAFRERVAAPTGMAPDERSQWGYWFERADPRRRLVRNCGVSGERTDEIAVRLEDCAAGAGALVIQGASTTSRRAATSPMRRATLRRWSARAGPAAAPSSSSRCSRGTTATPLRRRGSTSSTTASAPSASASACPHRRDRGAPGGLRGGCRRPDPAARGRMRPDLTIDGDHPSIAGYRRLAGLVVLP